MDICLGVLPTSPEQIPVLRRAIQTSAACSIAVVLSRVFCFGEIHFEWIERYNGLSGLVLHSTLTGTDIVKEERIRLCKRAADLRATGLTLLQISARMGRSEGEISKLVRAGRAAVLTSGQLDGSDVDETVSNAALAG